MVTERWLPGLAAGGVMLATTGAGAVDLSLGVGVGVAPDYEGSEDYTAIPLVQARIGEVLGPQTFVALEGFRLTSNLVAHPSLRLGPVVQYIPKRGSVENDAVDDLENVDPAVMVGVLAGWDLVASRETSFGVAVEAKGDVADGRGYLVTPQLRGSRLVLPALRLSGSLSTTWASESYVSDYFGIDRADARRSGLDRYDADAGIKDVGLGVVAAYSLTERWQVSAIGRYTRLVGDAADSPVVDDEGDANQLFGGVVVGYRF